MLLELDNFSPSSKSLLLLKVLDSLLPGDSGIEKLFISALVSFLLDESEFSFGGVVVYELDVPLSVENELLSIGFFFSGNFDLPLLFEHSLFFEFALLIHFLDRSPLIYLPVQDAHGLLDLLGFGGGFLNLSLVLFLMVEHPQLGVDLLFVDGLF